jgi:hypothetical protein
MEEAHVALKIKNLQDFWCGLLFLALGALAVYMSKDYQMGTALEMGPGYFPTWLGFIMMGFGVVIGGLSFKIEGESSEGLGWRDWAFRPWLVTTGAIIVYALMMDAEVGFVPSLIALVIGSSLAHKDVHVVETLVLSVCITAGAVAIFIYGIEMPYRLFWWSE